MPKLPSPVAMTRLDKASPAASDDYSSDGFRDGKGRHSRASTPRSGRPQGGGGHLAGDERPRERVERNDQAGGRRKGREGDNQSPRSGGVTGPGHATPGSSGRGRSNSGGEGEGGRDPRRGSGDGQSATGKGSERTAGSGQPSGHSVLRDSRVLRKASAHGNVLRSVVYYQNRFLVIDSVPAQPANPASAVSQHSEGGAPSGAGSGSGVAARGSERARGGQGGGELQQALADVWLTGGAPRTASRFPAKGCLATTTITPTNADARETAAAEATCDSGGGSSSRDTEGASANAGLLRLSVSSAEPPSENVDSSGFGNKDTERRGASSASKDVIGEGRGSREPDSPRRSSGSRRRQRRAGEECVVDAEEAPQARGSRSRSTEIVTGGQRRGDRRRQLPPEPAASPAVPASPPASGRAAMESLGPVDGRGIEIIVSDETGISHRPEVPAGGLAAKKALLKKIGTVLLDNRMNGKENSEHLLIERPEEYRVLKKVLNIMFVTVGVALLVSVFVVIVYTSVVGEKRTSSSSSSSSSSQSTDLHVNYTLDAHNLTTQLPQLPGR